MIIISLILIHTAVEEPDYPQYEWKTRTLKVTGTESMKIQVQCFEIVIEV